MQTWHTVSLAHHSHAEMMEQAKIAVQLTKMEAGQQAIGAKWLQKQMSRCQATADSEGLQTSRRACRGEA